MMLALQLHHSRLVRGMHFTQSTPAYPRRKGPLSGHNQPTAVEEGVSPEGPQRSGGRAQHVDSPGAEAIQRSNSSGRNTARAAVGGEFPTGALSIAPRVPSSAIAHVSASPPLIPDGRISRVRLAAAAIPEGPSQTSRGLSTRLHTPLGSMVIPPARCRASLPSK